MWSSEGREQAHYESVLSTINVIRDVLRECDTPSGLCDDHGLFAYADRAVIDRLDSAHAVKPDLILARRTELGENERVRMRNVDVVVEVKSDWSNLVTQAAMYAPAVLYSNWTGRFGLVIRVNHKTLLARFMFSHIDARTGDYIQLQESRGCRLLSCSPAGWPIRRRSPTLESDSITRAC
ncbi:hypothetical protein BS47DRAFT_992415 [Hydnum rufescens UP504]|uniref:Uncharacterized protein n=1 Tax=Hydnum rufescens UP504 TaxID=1448309 RepID=A0A9P6DWV0_9AGAM|nr:hypothetical protein BS47DRAFT_992415 [Hydnum rufescens UP504]